MLPVKRLVSAGPHLMRRYGRIFVSLALLLYGLIRIGVGSLLFGQEVGWLNLPAFQGPIEDIGGFLDRSADKQIVPVSVAGYLGYIALMGLVLAVGAIGSLRNRSFGLTFIGLFLVMYALLFINFQTINPKILHLAACAILFGLLLWLNRTHRGTA
ncbi:MAG: hypothetical protein NVV68_16565 [Dokdonella sp.]|nr:hypothetical protein [Dokdonella sp.]